MLLCRHRPQGAGRHRPLHQPTAQSEERQEALGPFGEDDGGPFVLQPESAQKGDPGPALGTELSTSPPAVRRAILHFIHILVFRSPDSEIDDNGRKGGEHRG